MDKAQAQARFGELRGETRVAADELDAIWAALDPVNARDILGSWKGADIPTGHPLDGMLGTIGWHGKTFNSVLDAQPLVCRGEDGELYSNAEIGNGEASLWNEEFRGEVTATMVYDGIPVHDHFKKVDDDTLIGIMNGKVGVLAAKAGIEVGPEHGHYYFVLERDSRG
ncbi:DUF4334 domain-containing protein [Streptomyces albidoflavus]|uniref:DUF4334 domain-containing protein n=1 Tax=Streptomyces albidoflavus TaxID=1886 RepID=UPI0033AA5931